ncbi:hypothetical protein [Thermoplasma volcanium GSS1]|uniref:DNA primase large subunit PriL n=1 Tax=Thermoplasma volcanium (strain ATCC 51530 / DSM 4299 / JCM 9571 / NBRC 15438 / GSS1) TaxID=273116 RepID=PRIL_THEVO|nr:DNA primase regulatory subunit PriL [Thermoplasma volcanium]Q97BA1.1 RecName: Full=DNA primase large subunit PriL [Thermoplasma volcanium GSS1]BAB59698.1 hypothetical protein [Thermoplasma volcanium GSS1]
MRFPPLLFFQDSEAVKRIANSVRGTKDDDAEIKDHSMRFIRNAISGDQQKEILNVDMLRYIAWVLVALNENIVTARTVIRERDAVEDALKNQQPEDIENFADDLKINMKYNRDLERFEIGVFDFVKYASRVTGSQYRLSNQSVIKGIVYCQKDVAIKILRESFVSNMFKVIDSIDQTTASPVLSDQTDSINELREFYKKSVYAKLTIGRGNTKAFPPCMKEIIRNLHEGINVPHMGRLAIASFLHKVGYTEDEIVEYFRNAPDFDESITRYQIKHLSGEISGVEYSPPKCETMRSNHLCFMDDDKLCHQDWMKHPLTYYEVKSRRLG